MSNISIRLDKKQQDTIQVIAKSIDRSRNWIINRAIENYIDSYEHQTERIKKSLEAADRGELISHEDAKKMLGI